MRQSQISLNIRSEIGYLPALHQLVIAQNQYIQPKFPGCFRKLRPRAFRRCKILPKSHFKSHNCDSEFDFYLQKIEEMMLRHTNFYKQKLSRGQKIGKFTTFPSANLSKIIFRVHKGTFKQKST